MSIDDRQIPDASQRQQALDPHTSVIVQAPAGSGKTTLLATRYVHLLTQVQRPEEILAITFTRKAAAEMRHRVTTLLSQDTAIAREIRKKDEAAGWHLFDNPNVLKIQTIDSFALEVASQTPHLASTAGLSITQQPQAFYTAASKMLFANLYEVAPTNALVAEFLSFLDNDAGRAERLMSFMLSRRDQWLTAVTSVANQRQLETTAYLLNAAISHLREEITEQLTHQFHADDGDMLRRVAAELNIENDLDTVLPLLLTGTGKLRKQLNKANGINDADLKRDVKFWLAEVLERGLDNSIVGYCKLPSIIDTSQSEDLYILQLCCVCLSLAAAELDQRFQAEGTIDFTGVLIRAKQALRGEDGPTDLALFLDYRIKHILVDEYQDTSQAQFEFFNLLTEGWQQDDSNTFFVVGDPMQSIYRFRDADVSIFAATKEHGLDTVKLVSCNLTANFRSQPAVVEWSNQLFEQIFAQKNAGQLGEVPFNPADAMVTATANAAVETFVFEEDEQETQYLVRHINNLLVASTKDDIVILCRARTHVARLLNELSKQEVAVQATDMDQLNESPVIKDLISLHRAFFDHSDKLAWYSLLRSPLFGVTLKQITQLNETDDSVKAIIDGLTEIPQLARLNTALAWAATRIHEIPVRELIEGIWFRCGGIDAYPEDHWPHALTWFELIDELGADAFDSTAVNDAVQTLFAASANEARVKVMTIHKAKGLEFAHVILPYLNKPSRSDEAQLIQWRASGEGLLMGVRGSDVHSWLTYEERQRAKNEEKRLLYVACTRAKTSLLASYTCEPSKKVGGLAKWLSHLAEPKDQVVEHTPTPQGSQTTLFNEPSMRRLPINYIWQPPHDDALTSTDTPATESRADQLSQRYEVALGLLVHEAVAWLTTPSGRLWMANRQATSGVRISTDPELQLRFQTWLQALPVAPENHTNLASEATTQIENMLADGKGRWILAPYANAHSEWPLTGVINGAMTHVILDRIFVDDNICWIVDFKTSSPKSGESVQEFCAKEMSRYRPQLEKYCTIATTLFTQEIRTALYFTSIGSLYVTE